MWHFTSEIWIWEAPCYLPGGEAVCAEEVATRLYPDVLAVLGADLAQLERGAHLAVQLVLLLGHLQHNNRQIFFVCTQIFLPWHDPRAWPVQPTTGRGWCCDRRGKGNWDRRYVNLWSSLIFVTIQDHLQSLPGSVQQGLTKRLVLRNGLENVPVCCHVADSPLAQPEHHRLALLYSLLYILFHSLLYSLFYILFYSLYYSIFYKSIV